ncbi:MAG: hypothetical protein ACE5RJ_01090 [Nitrosopumilaceae archaeon]
MSKFVQNKQKTDTLVALMQSKQKQQRARMYFCRLCRQYNIKARKAHLKNMHNTNGDAMSKRVTDDILSAIFLECNDS